MQNALFFALTGESHIRMSVRSHVSSPKLRSELRVQYGLGSKETRYILADLTKTYLDLFNDALSVFHDAVLQFIQRHKISRYITIPCVSLFNP